MFHMLRNGSSLASDAVYSLMGGSVVCMSHYPLLIRKSVHVNGSSRGQQHGITTGF